MAISRWIKVIEFGISISLVRLTRARNRVQGVSSTLQDDPRKAPCKGMPPITVNALYMKRFRH